jgi:hypothetical protein
MGEIIFRFYYFCSPSAILESVPLANVKYCLSADDVMLTNAIFELFNTNEFHKMAKHIKSKLYDNTIDYLKR